MTVNRRTLLTLAPASLAAIAAGPLARVASAEEARPAPSEVILDWYRLMLELVRHTATYSPPVASRAFAYIGIMAHEAAATGTPDGRSLAGQLNGLAALPSRPEGSLDEATVLSTLLSTAIGTFFSNTGPTGQRVMKRYADRAAARTRAGLSADVVARSETYAHAVFDHIFAWSESDGGAVVENMGFPLNYKLREGKANWVPTSLVSQQQVPLLPAWGKNRTFAVPNGASCSLPPPPPYSEEPDSAFYREAKEVYDTGRNLTPEQRLIARFWSDDPMLSSTPPGHWIALAVDLLDQEKAGHARCADVLARLGIALADSFIACWESKFEFDLLRPVTYIHRVIDPKWQPILITPPFPEYPSGHSTQSGAAADVLAAAFGEPFSFSDATHERDGLGVRSFPGFRAAAIEAAMSRLYGGIHFRAAIERGLEQGYCVAAAVNALKTRG